MISLAIIVRDIPASPADSGDKKRQLAEHIQVALAANVRQLVRTWPLECGLSADGGQLDEVVANADILLQHCGLDNEADYPVAVNRFLDAQPGGCVILFSGGIHDNEDLAPDDLANGEKAMIPHERVVVLSKGTMMQTVPICLSYILDTPRNRWSMTEIRALLLGGNLDDDAAIQFLAGVATLDLWWLATGRDDRTGLTDAAEHFLQYIEARTDDSFERCVAFSVAETIQGRTIRSFRREWRRLDKRLGGTAATPGRHSKPMDDAEALVARLAAAPNRADWIALIETARTHLLPR